MKKKLLLLGLLLIFNSAFSQVGIGTVTPEESAQLDISSRNKGLLIPRVYLESVTSQVPIEGDLAEGLTVFNLTDTNGLEAGYYYWFSSIWNKIAISSDIEGQLTDVQVDHIVGDNGYLVLPTEVPSGQVLQSDGSGGFIWVSIGGTGGGVTPDQSAAIALNTVKANVPKGGAGNSGKVLTIDGDDTYKWVQLSTGGDFKSDGTVNMTGNITFTGTQTVDGVDVSDLNDKVTSNSDKDNAQDLIIAANSSKVVITPVQAQAITANTSKNASQDTAIATNTDKVVITEAQSLAILANTKK